MSRKMAPRMNNNSVRCSFLAAMRHTREPLSLPKSNRMILLRNGIS
ncbi:hypothetical protein ACHAWF_008495 [Thalassiosira exigua]